MKVPRTQRCRLLTSGSCPSTVTKSQNQVTCEVLGPSSPKLMLSLKLHNQSTKVSNQEKLVQMLDPEVGMWHCLLTDKDQVLLESSVECE